ncbi:FAD:protein FMN transferase [Synoicihabitans lomoniglobus]|uniref:FAD:protein FMN transferase n=1 Tax=Synoicihabitans lomoniglobus TaxID=2909285 RepID=A0AAF0CQP9_9BACT|nr:FAD:protein FMN transferase [Opitutaceae bacterium LMO-M01]WED66325.1 FAD:protein FMN transferase [Opitutaceae bacterium LMO-M01]
MNTPHPTRRRFLRIAAVHTVALAALGAHAATAASSPRRWRGIALGGEVGIDLYGADAAAADVFARCRSEMLRLEKVFSLYDDRSALSHLNREGALADAPHELRDVLALAKRVSEASAGAFDVTVHPLCETLAQGETDPAALAAARDLVDYERVIVAGTRVVLDRPGMAVTLNGIAQGYITDRITDVLTEAGYRAALVDIGEKRALGEHPDRRAWRVGVRDPVGDGLAGVIDLPSGYAMATSGGYGQRYAAGNRHHLLDARAAESRHDWASVTVIAPQAAVADALSTALAVSAPESAQAILAQFENVEARVLTTTGDWLTVAA